MKEIKEKVQIARPSWRKDKERIVDMLCSPKPWDFELQEQIRQERALGHAQDQLI